MTDYRVTFMEKGRAALVRHPFDGGAAAGEIVGKNLLSLISTGSERGGFTQDFPADSYPMETGSSSIAQVLEVGEGVTGFAPGDLFYHNGHHTRYVRLPQGDAIAVPGGAEPEKVLFGRYAAVSMTSIYHMKARAVDNIIVTGQGMVGVMCAAVLQAFGFEVYAVDPSPERRAAAREAGIRRVGESLAALGAAEKSCGAHMECSGNENALRAALPYLRRGGEIFQIGVPWHKNSDWDAHSLLYEMFYAYVSIQGGWEWSIPLKSDEFHAHSSFEHIRTAMQLIADGRIVIPEAMFELRDPRECNAVYTEITVPRMRPTSMILDWRKFAEGAQ
ncbi:zinc-binding dehydrogenase [Allofournierella sp.]|uniref:zinc-binding dehydrogenase n=1 Tax=Allofournierella sp. TaxID=1940256 RepID=UPI003AB74959